MEHTTYLYQYVSRWHKELLLAILRCQGEWCYRCVWSCPVQVRLILCLVMCVYVLTDEMPPSAITLKQEKTDSKLRFKCVCRYVWLAAKCVSVKTTCWKATAGFLFLLQQGFLPLARRSATGVSHTVVLLTDMIVHFQTATASFRVPDCP